MDWWTPVISIISAGCGSYLGSYLRRKGENLASHEDLILLTAQLEATTNVTKNIEARISNEIWDRQKQWELKRDSLSVMLQALHKAVDAHRGLFIAHEMFMKHSKEEGLSAFKKEKSIDWLSAIAVYDEKRVLAIIVCSSETRKALYKIRQTLRGSMASHLKVCKTYDDFGEDIRSQMQEVIFRVRIELGITTDESEDD